MIRTLTRVFPLISLLGLLSCVTVNVNFPESAVQKATDDYVRELYRAKEKGKAPAPQASALPEKQANIGLSFSLIPSAHAAGEFVFKVDSPKALKIRDRLAKRVDEVLTQKKAGVLGESNDGLLVLKEPGKLKKLLLKKIETLVSEENADRNDLYEDVATFNSLPSNRLQDVKKSFARSFQAESPSGTWIQDGDGSWSQKP